MRAGRELESVAGATSLSFIILFQGRSGSSWLVDALSSHPAILVKGEALIALRSMGDDQVVWAREFLWQLRSLDSIAIGFKAKLSDISAPEAFASMLRSLDCRVIHLKRQNLVKQTISWIRSDLLFRDFGRHNREAGDPPLPAIQVDIPDFLARIQQLERGQRKLEDYVMSLRQPTVRLNYEAILSHPEREFSRVLAFLGLPINSLEWTIEKNTDDDLAHAVLNFQQLHEALSCTQWFEMFDALRPSLQ